MDNIKIILASNSPRRRELLSQVGLSFQVITSNIDEHTALTAPKDIVMDLSMQKVMAVVDEYTFDNDESILFIGSDTVVAKDKLVLGKPIDEKDAYNMLTIISNTYHNVYTGVSMLMFKGDKLMWQESFAEDTKVYIDELSDEAKKLYIASGDPMDKAGSYGIQGSFAAYVSRIEGDYNNVVGLPVAKLCKLLRNHGLMV